MTAEVEHRLTRLSRLFLVAGVLGVALDFALGYAIHAPYYNAYLFAFVYWLALPLGGAMTLMVHHLTGGKWGWSIRRLNEATTATLPLFVLLFIPIAIGLPHIYHWARLDHPISEALRRKTLYLNPPFFYARAALFFVLWGGAAWLLYRWSRREEREGGQKLSYRLQQLSGYGLAMFCLTISFASVDWIMSLKAQWYSSILGMYVIIGMALTAVAVVSLTATLVARYDQDPDASPDRLHDLGNLLLVLVVLHTYLAFSQYFVIWNGNTPATVSWLVPRTRGVWKIMAFLIMAVEFGLPFLALLFRQLKRAPSMLMTIAVVILVGRAIDDAWLVLPAGNPRSWPDAFVALGAFVGVGGLTLSMFLRRWRAVARDASPHATAPASTTATQAPPGRSTAFPGGEVSS